MTRRLPATFTSYYSRRTLNRLLTAATVSVIVFLALGGTILIVPFLR